MGIGVTAVAVVYQCAEITKIAQGRGTDRPNHAIPALYLVNLTPFTGLPRPMKTAGMRADLQ